MFKIGVLVSGGGTNLQCIIDAIGRGEIRAEIATVVSSRPGAYALERAKNHGISACCIRPKSFESQTAYEDALILHLQEKKVDLVIFAGFLVIVTDRFVQAFTGRVINVHPSLIPSFCGAGYYGLHVHQAALEKGVKVTGATVHIVTAGTDEGPILMQKAVDVLDGDTPETLQKRVMTQAEQVILPRAVQLMIDKIQEGKA